VRLAQGEKVKGAYAQTRAVFPEIFGEIVAEDAGIAV
jgi:hypothetical protein